MRMIGSRRVRAGLGIVAGAVALVALAGSPAAASPLFTGGGRGLSAPAAIQGAFEDGQNTAQSVGFYGACTVVGDPAVFETFNHPYFGHVFFAEVTVDCQR